MPEPLTTPPAPSGRDHCWLPRSPRSPALARHLLREFLSRVPSGERFVEDGVLVLTELVGNAFRHGTPRGNLIKMGLETDGELLWLWVEDVSRKAPQLRVTADGEAGRGLLLVDKLSHKWGWGPRGGHGKRVWAVIEPGPAVA
ncbi:ATP-binding protein [Kitasatospora sp. GAS204B]|uniref:ATP-binding protein n=1 Tax=unclassified Kitasatospora TaxID=2633591 RepID=UPI00247531D3|nr:ATP-binding protein [Kitasatospora sp. GAS204B]MDH6115704.1 anti-sigma regulatory factor (Ser/Thr protein kinase) [Kitasatospora sp. GAS204B]